MPDNTIKVAIHHLKRNPENIYEVHQGNRQLAVSATAKRLVDELHKLYARRPSKAYGKFSENTVDYPTSVRLTEYITQMASFEDTTTALMNTLAREAQGRGGSEGGHVFFAHFQREDKQYILVAIVNDKISAALTDAADLQDVKHLDVDGYRFAGRVSLDGWANNEERYVSFLKGKGNVSEYFMAFLGCDTTAASRVDTSNMVKAIKHFADSRPFNPAQRTEFMVRANDICARDSKADKPINFVTLANELYPDYPEALIEVLADPDRGLNDGFVPNRRALRGLVSFRHKTPNWSVEFDRAALNSEKVRFEPETNSIILFDVPDDLRNELLAERADGE